MTDLTVSTGHINRVSRQLFALCVVAFALPAIANAEPTAAYVKCQKFLAAQSDSHLDKTARLRKKYDSKFDDIVKRELAKNSSRRTSDEGLLAAVESIKRLRRIDQAAIAYRESVHEEFVKATDEDGPDFECLERSQVVLTFKLNYQAYEKVLQLIEEDIEERFDIEDINDDEGLVVIAFNATQSTNFVRINRRNAIGGNLIFGPLRRGEYFRVMRAKAGTYNWDKIEQKFYNSRRVYNLSKLDLGFVVEAGKLNYAGVFMLDVEAGGYYSATLNDRLVITLTALEQRYPKLIDQYEIANGLQADDRFTEFYLNEKRLMTSKVENESSD